MATRLCFNCNGSGWIEWARNRGGEVCRYCNGSGVVLADTPVSLPHLNVEDMDEVEGKWRKRRNERKGLV